jgi:hypothetical protein
MISEIAATVRLLMRHSLQTPARTLRFDPSARNDYLVGSVSLRGAGRYVIYVKVGTGVI